MAPARAAGSWRTSSSTGRAPPRVGPFRVLRTDRGFLVTGRGPGLGPARARSSGAACGRRPPGDEVAIGDDARWSWRDDRLARRRVRPAAQRASRARRRGDPPLPAGAARGRRDRRSPAQAGRDRRGDPVPARRGRVRRALEGRAVPARDRRATARRTPVETARWAGELYGESCSSSAPTSLPGSSPGTTPTACSTRRAWGWRRGQATRASVSTRSWRRARAARSGRAVRDSRPPGLVDRDPGPRCGAASRSTIWFRRRLPRSSSELGLYRS